MKCSDCKSKPVLNRRVTIQRQKTGVEDDHNQVDPTDDANWETVDSRWAEFKSLGGSERFASEHIQAGQTHRVTMRFDRTTAAVTPADRLKMGDRKFGINWIVDKDERHEWIVAGVAEEK